MSYEEKEVRDERAERIEEISLGLSFETTTNKLGRENVIEEEDPKKFVIN